MADNVIPIALERGPWSCDATGRILDADGVLVTWVPLPKGAGAYARRRARTKLIATVLKLLEAAELALVKHEDVACSCGGCGALRAAIAEARGKP